MSKSASSFTAPGFITLILEVILCLIIGAVIGCVLLVYKDVTIVHAAAVEPEPGVVYYVIPKMASGRGVPAVQQKLGQAETGRAIALTLTEEEANIWMYSQFQVMKPLNPEEEEKPETHMARLDVGNPRVRYEGDKLALTGILRTNMFHRPAKDIPLQVSGDFSVKEHKASLVIEKAYIGALPLHKVPMGIWLADRLLGLEKMQEFIDKPRKMVEKAHTGFLDAEAQQLKLAYPILSIAR